VSAQTSRTPNLLRWLHPASLSRADRADAAMLVLPVLLIGLTIAVAQWTAGQQQTERPFVATLQEGAKRALTGMPRTQVEVRPVAPAPEVVAGTQPAQQTVAAAVSAPESVTPSNTLPNEIAAVDRPGSLVEPPPIPGDPVAAAPATDAIFAGGPPRVDATIPAPVRESVRTTFPQAVIAALATPPEDEARDLGPSSTARVHSAPGGILGLDGETGQCPFEPEVAQSALPRTWNADDPESFGLALAAAAREQLDDFVIYNDRYTRLKYPMGDVHPMYGVCTDVIIRAYRALGIDLQQLVQQTKSGSGDPNIDHRRVDTLRKFFARYGENIPASSFAEDYRPGDIVSYWRPQNRHSRTHIAIVSDMVGPSGRPLIIHNRGWGPQQEDGLFVDQITGHYRFRGLDPEAVGGASPAAPNRANNAQSKGVSEVGPVVRTTLSATDGQPPASPPPRAR
jgi:uncharacterized protein YijF (DUF1287 family)